MYSRYILNSKQLYTLCARVGDVGSSGLLLGSARDASRCRTEEQPAAPADLEGDPVGALERDERITLPTILQSTP